MTTSSIEWTNATWNPVRGCSRVSAGCQNCYAERLAARNLPEMRSPTTGKAFAQMGVHGPRWTGKVELIPSKLDEPLGWRKPRRIFVNSMSDLFHEALSVESQARVFAVMADAPRHTFQILTKRPARMREFLTTKGVQAEMACWMKGNHRVPVAGAAWNGPWPLPNVWLGVSVEDQATAHERIPLLLQTPAAVRFVSYEPALGPVDFSQWMWPVHEHWPAPYRGPDEARAAGVVVTRHRQALVSAFAVFIDWIIVGGESGPCARPFSLRWARQARVQCREAGTAFFMKQVGARPCNPTCASADCTHPDCDPGWLKLRDRKGGNPAEWPEDLRVRQFPGEVRAI